MGSSVRIVVYAQEEEHAFIAASAAFDRILALEEVMSDYRPDSELSLLPGRAQTDFAPVSDDLFKVLHRAQQFSAASDGAFDVTVGPLTRLWREARLHGRLPDADRLADVLSRVGYTRLTLNENSRTVRFDTPGMRLDLGGIGKGFAADAAASVLRDHAIDHYLVDLGGDIVLGDPPPGRAGWLIRIDAPGGAEPLLIANQAVATSGDTERFIEVDGIRYSHILDPRTGLGVTHRLHVTVVAPNGTDADALASAVSVLGPEGAAPLLAAFEGVSVRAVDAEGRETLCAGPAFAPAAARRD